MLVKTTTGNFAAYKKAARPKLLEGDGVAVDDFNALVRSTGRVRVRAARSLQNSLVVCSGDLAAPNRGPQLHQLSGLGCSVAFVGGDAEVGEVGDALLVCSGEARLGGMVGNAVVLARGPVTISQRSSVGGANLIVSGGKIKKPGPVPPGGATLQEGKARPLGFVRFFEAGRVGVEVGKARNRDGARVTKLDANKGFARGGCGRATWSRRWTARP